MQTIEELLEIPAFLKREPGEVRSQKPAPVQTVKKTVNSLNAPMPREKQRSPMEWAFLIRDKFEDLMDERNFLDNGMVFDTLKEHKSRKGVISYLTETYTEAKAELKEARGEYAEYFEGVTDEEIEYRVKCYVSLLSDLTLVQQNKRATRKPRKVRKSAEKKVKQVAYKVMDNDLKIESIDPAKLVGAASLLAYNVKYKRMQYFVAKDGGLEISGTTIKNFDESKSFSKTLRKPEMLVSKFREAINEKRVEVLFEMVNGKAFPITGRLNGDILLLKAFS